MYILTKDGILFGFSDKKESGYENIKISMEEYLEYLEKQKKDFTLIWNVNKKSIEFIKLEPFEFINEYGKIEKDIESENKHNIELLLNIKKEKIKLMKDIKDFEEFNEDVTYLKQQLDLKEKEISELEMKLKK